jgi:hypothetical protein
VPASSRQIDARKWRVATTVTRFAQTSPSKRAVLRHRVLESAWTHLSEVPQKGEAIVVGSQKANSRVPHSVRFTKTTAAGIGRCGKSR